MKTGNTFTKKSLQLALAVAAFSFNTSAQSLNISGGVNIGQTHIYEGGERLYQDYSESYTGPGGSSSTTEYGLKPVIGYNAALAYEFNISERFAIVPGFKLSTKGYKLEYKSEYTSSTYSYSEKESQALRMNVLDIPINFKFGITTGDVKVYAQTGVYFGMVLFGNVTYKAEGEDSDGYNYKAEDRESINDMYDDAKDRMNAGLTLGAGVEFKNFFLEANYNAGLLSFNTDNVSLINHDVGVSVGYKIKTKKSK